MKADMKLNPREVKKGKLSSVSLTKATTLFRLYGTLLIRNLFPKEFIEGLYDEYMEEVDALGEKGLEEKYLKVGDKRYMTTVKICGSFNDPEIYANPIFMEILRELLGEHCIINGFGGVVAYPGSTDQHLHLDHPRLFGVEEINAALPPYAITVMIPLIDLNEINGTTRVWEGSHTAHDDTGMLLGSDLVECEAGACFLMDYRLWHGGTANVGERARPLLYSLYSRQWFLDSANYYKQDRLVVPAEDLERIPEEHRELFKFARIIPKGDPE